MNEIKLNSFYTHKSNDLKDPFSESYLVAMPIEIKGRYVKYKFWANPITSKPFMPRVASERSLLIEDFNFSWSLNT